MGPKAWIHRPNGARSAALAPARRLSTEPSGAPTPATGPFVFRNDSSDGFGRYHDLVGASGAATSRVGEGFDATVSARNAPGVMLFDRQIVGAEHRRELTHIRRDGLEHFYLQVLRSGLLLTGLSGEERWLAPGDAVLMDATRPMRTVVVAADYVTVVLPRPLVEAAAPDARALHGRRIPRAAAGGLGDAVLSLVRCAPDLDGEAMSQSGAMVADLLAGVASRGEARDDVAMRAPDRLRAVLFIDAHIARPGLDVAAVAAGVGLSRSALYRAFEAVGGVEREIIRRRIARFRATLMRPGERRPTELLALGHGFSSHSHCSRLFKATYGLTPGACRAGLREAQGERSGLHFDHMRDWYEQMGAGA